MIPSNCHETVRILLCGMFSVINTTKSPSLLTEFKYVQAEGANNRTGGNNMKLTISKENETQAEAILTLPKEVLKDLRKIAVFNNSGLNDLVYSYIVDGIASDSRIVKRMEFEDNANVSLGGKSIHSKTAKEIINDFNLVY
jgi:hypothetical protein